MALVMDERQKFIENTLDLWSRDPTMTTSKLIGMLYDDCRTALRESDRAVEKLQRENMIMRYLLILGGWVDPTIDANIADKDHPALTQEPPR